MSLAGQGISGLRDHVWRFTRNSSRPGSRFRAFAIDAMLNGSAAMGMRLAGWPAARQERKIERPWDLTN
jgi:hypothetical protein